MLVVKRFVRFTVLALFPLSLFLFRFFFFPLSILFLSFVSAGRLRGEQEIGLPRFDPQ